MKNFKLFGAIALVVVIGFIMAGCQTGDSGNNDSTSATYISYDASGNIYTLVVTKDPNRAVYIPQSGDTYVLTIKNSAGTVIGTSTGTVTEISGSNFTLESGGDEFSVIISGSTISEIIADNGIPVVDGEPISAPETLIPNKPGGGNGTSTWEFKVDSSGNSSCNALPIASLLTNALKQNTTYIVRISGVTDTAMPSGKFGLWFCTTYENAWSQISTNAPRADAIAIGAFNATFEITTKNDSVIVEHPDYNMFQFYLNPIVSPETSPIGTLRMTLTNVIVTISEKDSGGTPNPGPGGSFMVTDIPAEYNGKYALALDDYAPKTYLMGYTSMTYNPQTFHAVIITDGSVSLPLWVLSLYSVIRYTGNGTFDLFFKIYNEESILNTLPPVQAVQTITFSSVTFSNGSATISYNNRNIP